MNFEKGNNFIRSLVQQFAKHLHKTRHGMNNDENSHVFNVK